MSTTNMMYSTPDQQTMEAASKWESFQMNGYLGSTSDKDRVEHDYHDHSSDKDFQELYPPGMSFHLFPNLLGGRGPEQTFPMKLHAMLEQIEKDGLASVVSWQAHGRCFVVHKQEEFVAHILQRWFRQSKFPSFQRQLNMYGFKRITSGRDKGGYYHELFLREKKFLCLRIQRLKIKGTGVRKPSSPESEPDFYHMKFLPELGSKEKRATGPMVLIDPGEMNATPRVQQGPALTSLSPSCPQINPWGHTPQLSTQTQQGPVVDSQRQACPPAHAWVQGQQNLNASLQDYWSFCEPRPMAEVTASQQQLLLPGMTMAPMKSNSSEKDMASRLVPVLSNSSEKDMASRLVPVLSNSSEKDMASKPIPSPQDFSIADAFKNTFKPVMPFAQAVIQTTDPSYVPASCNKSQISLAPPEDDLDCQFDFDEAMESLLKIPMPSTLPSKMPPQAYAVHEV